MKLISIALCAVLITACGADTTPTVTDTEISAPAPPVEEPLIEEREEVEEIAQPEKVEPTLEDLSDLNERYDGLWRPRSFDFPGTCNELDPDDDDRAVPEKWWEEFENTRDFVLQHGEAVFAGEIEPDVEFAALYVELWESFCPPVGWEQQHEILLVGLWLMEDANYYLQRYNETGFDEYEAQALGSYLESVRYIEQGIRDAVPWYGDMPVISTDDPRVDRCLKGGLHDQHFMPLCDDYSGPLYDPDSRHYQPDATTIAEYLRDQAEWEEWQREWRNKDEY